MLDLFIVQLVLAGAVVTLMNRLMGHYVLARFEPIHFRLEAALEAVPVAVVTTLVIPAAVQGGPAEWIAFGIAMVLSLRAPFVVSVSVSIAVLLVLRSSGLFAL